MKLAVEIQRGAVSDDTRARVAMVRPILRATLFALAGERVTVEGRTVRTRGFRLMSPPPAPVPIYVAALMPPMLELAGEIADGVIMQVGIHPACLSEAIARVGLGAARAGRDPATVDLVCSTFTAIDEDRGRAIDRATRNKGMLASTIGRHANDNMVSFYLNTPSGFMIEYGYDGITVDDDATWVPQVTGAHTVWGHRWLLGGGGR